LCATPASDVPANPLSSPPPGKNTLKRHSVGIWHCRACRKTMTGGAYLPATPAAVAMRSTLRRLRDITTA
jgi:ribosomal protein L37AE/L43A